jgi:hypothetical protein
MCAMTEKQRLEALKTRHANLMRKQGELRQQHGLLIDRSRNCMARALGLLSRSRAMGVEQISGSRSSATFSTPIAICGQADTVVLNTIGDLIEFVQRTGHARPVLRDEIFVAAALPTPERLNAVRSLAVASFRANGMSVDPG